MNRVCIIYVSYILFNTFYLSLYAQENVTSESVWHPNINTTPFATVIIQNVREINDTENTTANESLQSNQSNPSKTNISWHPKVTNSKSKTNKKPSLRTMVTPCTTPNGEDALCIQLRNCSTLVQQLEKKSDADFLQPFHCGPRNEKITDNLHVCCPTSNNSNKLDPLPATCGHQNVIVKGRIFGGKEASLGEFPWMARLIHKDKQKSKVFGCSGFLITPEYVLTAAHCLKSENIPVLGPVFEVQFGEHNTETKKDCNTKKTKCADPPQVKRIRKSIVHPQYIMNSVNHHNDIGLIHLKNEVRITNYVSPICLLDKQKTDAFEYWISGWGSTKKQQLSSIKMKVSLPPFPHSNCTEKYKQISVQIIDHQICAGGVKNKDSCTGDSGGPLMFVKDRNWFAAGVVSYGLGCGTEGWPGVYTNVPSYIDWIRTTILKRATASETTNNTKNKKKSVKSAPQN